MSITIHDTLTRRPQPLSPVEPGHVRLYVCGITTYDDCHLGHARLVCAFDVVVRWLRARDLRVTYVRNITDIDDKIIRRAGELGETPAALTDRYIVRMHEDFAALGVLLPDVEPRATAYVPQMIDLIGLLEKNGLAYQAEVGADRGAEGADVNFAVRRFPAYGKLSGKSLDELRAGERVAVGVGKRDPLDFVLWKAAKPGEPQWSSNWGPGRPGWHLECSAMAGTILGEPLDIHGGGPDLVFPHHENEIAQSEGAHGGTYAQLWMHCGALRLGEHKMSKSLGNLLTIRQAREQCDAEAIRLMLIRPHYRSPIAFEPGLLEEARSALSRLYGALREVPMPAAADSGAAARIDWAAPYASRFAAALDDDFNTPEAFAVLFELAGEINRTRDAALAARLRALGGVLGLLQRDAAAWFQGDGAGGADARIDTLIRERAQAKQARDFGAADRIRQTLLDQGIVLEDSATGTTWRRA